MKWHSCCYAGHCLGGFGGVRGDDNVLDSTFLMSHLNEVTFMLLRCALFVVHELVLWLLRSLWFMHMKWHMCCYGAHSSWYMSWSFCCYVPCGSCTWSDIRVAQHIHQLAAKRLLEHPGLHSGLSAFALYRQKRINLLNVKPGIYYDFNTDKSWQPWNKQTPSGCGGARLQGDRPLLVIFHETLIKHHSTRYKIGGKCTKYPYCWLYYISH